MSNKVKSGGMFSPTRDMRNPFHNTLHQLFGWSGSFSGPQRRTAPDLRESHQPITCCLLVSRVVSTGVKKHVCKNFEWCVLPAVDHCTLIRTPMVVSSIFPPRSCNGFEIIFSRNERGLSLLLKKLATMSAASKRRETDRNSLISNLSNIVRIRDNLFSVDWQLFPWV